MSKYRRIKNAKHSLRKMRNRIRRKGDSWYSKPWLVTQRRDGRRDILKSRTIEKGLEGEEANS